MPAAEEVRLNGIRTGEAREATSDEEWLKGMFRDLVKRREVRPSEARKPEAVQLGEGLSPMPGRLVEKIQAGEFVEFAEFPIMDGRARLAKPVEQEAGDHVVVVQASNRRRARREVPDASMWGSCFTLFERAVLLGNPDRGL